MNKEMRNVPVIFQKLKDYTNSLTDTRFMEVKIWLMHLGENFNGSYFSKEVVKKAIPTLANTPILGYVEADINGNDDFSDHRSIVYKDNGKYRTKYIGSAYGIIPETNDAKFEKRIGDDGVEREYLTCRGLVWRKNEEAIDIFNRDSIKAQSMELHEDYDGEMGDDGLFHFTDFKFFGACALGDGVEPAMINATIEKHFSYNEMHKFIQEKMEEFKKLEYMRENNDEKFNSGNSEEASKELLSYEEGGHDMEVEKIENEVVEEAVVEEKAEETEVVEEKQAEMFALTAQQLTGELVRLLEGDCGRDYMDEDDWEYRCPRCFYLDHDDNYVYAQSLEDGWRLVRYSYTLDADVPVIDFESKEFVKIEYTPLEGAEEVEVVEPLFRAKGYVENSLIAKDKEFEAKQNTLTEKFNLEKEEALGEIQVELENLKEEYSKLEKESIDIKEKLSVYMSKEKEEAIKAIFDKFVNVFTDEDEEFVSLKEKAFEFENLEDLENKLYALAGKKALSTFTKKQKVEKEEGNVLKIDVDFSAKEELVNPILRKWESNC